MNRRSFFRRSAGAAGAAVVTPVAAMLPGPSEEERDRALIEDVLANPGKYPEIEAKAAKLRGESYQRGVRAGLAGAIDQYYSVMDLATVTTAHAEGIVVARLDERPPRRA